MSTSVNSVVRHFPSSEGTFATSLSSTITAGATTVPLNALPGFVDGEVAVLTVDPADAIKKQTFTGTVDTAGLQLINVVWTAGTNQTHTAGAQVVDYASATHISMISKGLLVEHNQDGTHQSTMTVGGVSIAAGLSPTGAVVPYAGASAPTGWLLADGTAVSRITYSALYAVVGTTYGVGDGSSTFNLPNLKGKIPVGKNSSDTEFDVLGETGGEKTHALTTAELATHSHGVSDPSHSHGGSVSAPYTTAAGGNQSGAGIPPHSGFPSAGSWGGGLYIAPNGTGISIQNAGSGTAHNNLQPYVTLNYIIKV